MSGPYKSVTSLEVHDPAWDAFVSETPSGHYMQSTAWGDFKLGFHWTVVRLSLLRGHEVAAGAQVLLRHLPGLGALGWAPRAPVLREPDAELMERTLHELGHLVKRHGIRVLMLQPAHDGGPLEALPRFGFRPSPVVMAPRATIFLDLEPTLETLQAQMRAKTRQHIRKGLREGVTVREGDVGEVETFYRLHLQTSERQNFVPYPKRHFTEMWRAFGPLGGVRLFLAEYEGEPLSGLVVLIHSDTVHTHAMAWSGRHTGCMANEVLLWSAIAWSKEHGYRRWDFTWIDPRAGEAIASGKPLPEDLRNSVTFFKLGFGGVVTVLPGAYDYIPNPALRAVVRTLVPPIYRLRSVQKAHHRLRWRWMPSREAGDRGARRDVARRPS